MTHTYNVNKQLKHEKPYPIRFYRLVNWFSIMDKFIRPKKKLPDVTPEINPRMTEEGSSK